MLPALALRQKINGPGLTLGVLATDHLWPGLVELCQRAGLDYMILDREHGPHSDEAVAEACRIGRLMDFPVVVRTISTQHDVVRRAVDMGPCGLMFPTVESSEQLDEAREALYMPLRGRRRPGGPGNAWPSTFDYESWKTEWEDHLVVLPQIESRRGLEHARAIAAHPIVTAIAAGPYDLSAELGCCWQPEAPQLQDALQQIREAGRAAGKNMWMIGDGPNLVRQGFTFICLGEPCALLAGALRRAVSETRT